MISKMDVKTPQTRHKCILCGRKKARSKMVKHRSHYTCNTCLKPTGAGFSGGTLFEITRALPGIQPAPFAQEIEGQAGRELRVLNLYAGIGGNRKFWAGCKVTAVEYNVQVAVAYQSLYPDDTVVIGDAHEYLLKNYHKFDFIWSSPPCQSHTRMNYWTPGQKKRYIDLSLYTEIILLQSFFKGKFVVENVDGYYPALIPPTKKLGRHLFWANFDITDYYKAPLEDMFVTHDMAFKTKIMEWLGIHYQKNIYLTGKNYIQVFRNCVHPDIGLSVFNDYIRQS